MGHRIGEYEIVRLLGAGGFGITYLAFDHQLDGPVALKEYFPADAARRVAGRRVAPSTTENRAVFAWGLDRFIEEARAIHRLRHPNVVTAHRYLEAHGTAYIVMEYVEGRSLQRVLDGLVGRQHLSVDQWRRWMDQLLDALGHVHRHGYLHRDVKPANIMIRFARPLSGRRSRSKDPTPLLIDFGAARMAARDRTHTQILTDVYAPIEQYSHGALQGPPTDIYALAAVSYRVLTGELLPSAPDRVLHDDYKPLAGRKIRADPQWLTAIDQGLALRPENRPQEIPAWRAAMRGSGPQVRTGSAKADPNRTARGDGRRFHIGSTSATVETSARQPQFGVSHEYGQHVRTTHTIPERSSTRPTLLRRTMRWSKWAVYCSSAILWLALFSIESFDEWLEGLPNPAKWLAFYLTLCGWPMLACWDIVLKPTIDRFRSARESGADWEQSFRSAMEG